MRSTIPSDTSIFRAFPTAVSSQRHGIALMLVVVTLATATILTTSFLVSSENTPEIGQAAQNRVTSEWSAQSTATLIEAAMETTADWRTLAASGLLLSDTAILGADVSVALTNLEGTVAGDDDGYVLLTVIAKVGGIESVVQRVLSERDLGTYEEALDPELKEFGIFVNSQMRVTSGSYIAAWEESPVARAGDPGKLGVGFSSAGALSVAANSIEDDLLVFMPPTATAGLESTLLSISDDSEKLPVSLWSTTAELPASLGGAPAQVVSTVPLDITTDTTLLGGRYSGDVMIQGGVVVEFDEANSPYMFGSEDVGGTSLGVDGSTLRIVGNVTIGIYDSFKIRDSVIELVGNARLTVYHADSVLVENSTVGVDPALQALASRSPEDVRGFWLDPRRVRFIQINRNADPMNDNFVIRGRSIFVGSIHAPSARMTVRNSSTLAGRVSVDELELIENSAILLDPIFDNKLGITEADLSPLYDTDGTLVSGLSDAMQATFAAEGFAAAEARVLSMLPAQIIPTDTPVNGANRRFAGTVRLLREWPVRVRLQEQDNDDDDFFDVPRDETVAAAFGDDVFDELVRIVIEEGGTAPTGGGGGGGGEATNRSVFDVLDDL